MNELLGLRIKEIRIAHQYTQEQVAQKLQMTRQKYARIENGKNNISLDLLTKLSKIFNVTVEDITKVIEEDSVVEYSSGDNQTTAIDVFDMLDFFYANKHLYHKLNK